MRVWVLTYNDGDYYSTYDMFLSVHATKESAQNEGARLANESFERALKSNPRFAEHMGTWVLTNVADSFARADPEAAELHYKSGTWYVTPEEVQP